MGFVAVDLASSWCATDLGAYRLCRSTYERCPLDSVPPVRDALDRFQWLGDRGRPSAANIEGLARLENRGAGSPGEEPHRRRCGAAGGLRRVLLLGWLDIRAG